MVYVQDMELSVSGFWTVSRKPSTVNRARTQLKQTKRQKTRQRTSQPFGLQGYD